MAEPAKVSVPPVALSARLAELPIRRIIQGVLIVLIVLGVTLGTWKTLTLPKTDPRHFSGGAWRDLVVDQESVCQDARVGRSEDDDDPAEQLGRPEAK